MKKTNVSYLPRTKNLDEAISSIQRRMTTFRSMYADELVSSDPDFTVDYNVAGKPWVRIPAEDEFAHFEVGNYRIALDKDANFSIRYDIIANRIKDISADIEE
jgi:hypothetical protein